jgi:hypothetical protein
MTAILDLGIPGRLIGRGTEMEQARPAPARGRVRARVVDNSPAARGLFSLSR